MGEAYTWAVYLASRCRLFLRSNELFPMALKAANRLFLESWTE
ncbi:hypothetical protein TGAM01_v204357 [Trichoderma gamsii]|uniref:Uncharacterized protein n=1 Tax=Trichoderma gamsii TaxID=398673 RepID=A0A2P4ZRC8_9HYPO|nr:hypothetical protein TGAM01_v204357 [Trichoderma gamsii]PON26856.1 hypothetical protein TGAM01_v204357 [Trichoderma gamsii]